MPIAPVETPAAILLPGGRLEYVLRRTPRSRGLRITIHSERGLVVSIPPATRHGWAHPEAHVDALLRQREGWIRRHLGRQAAERRAFDERPDLGEGRRVPYGGVPHRVLVVAGPDRRHSLVSVVADSRDPELLVELAARDAGRVGAVLEGWFRARARSAIEAAVARHVAAIGVAPHAVTLRDPRSRWGSCSRARRLSFSWRLVLAPPEALDAVVVHELCHLRVFGHGPRFRALLAAHAPDHVRWRRWLHDHGAELHAALLPTMASAAA